MTRFVLGATTVQFNCDPIRPGGERPQLFQQTGRSGGGDLYVYGKSSLQRTDHRLRFPRVDETTRAALLNFIRNGAQGGKNSFTWIDHTEVSRRVKFAAPRLKFVDVGPGQYVIDIVVQEDN